MDFEFSKGKFRFVTRLVHRNDDKSCYEVFGKLNWGERDYILLEEYLLSVIKREVAR